MPSNGKFDYPDQGWSTGNMRMAMMDPRQQDLWGSMGVRAGTQEQKRRRDTKVSQADMTPEDFGKYWQGNWNVIGDASSVNSSKADSSGIVIKKGHPQIKELEDSGWETVGIPKSDPWNKDYQFMRPPAAG